MELQDYIKKYISNFHQVEREFELYKNIKLEVRKKEDKVNRYSCFFSTIVVSLQCSYFLKLSKILLKSEEKNIYKLIEQCRNNEKNIENYDLLEPLLNKFKEDLDAENEMIKKVKFLRDKYFAHPDSAYFFEPEKAFEEAAIKNYNIENFFLILNKYLKEISNILKLDFDNSQKYTMNFELAKILEKI